MLSFYQMLIDKMLSDGEYNLLTYLLTSILSPNCWKYLVVDKFSEKCYYEVFWPGFYTNIQVDAQTSKLAKCYFAKAVFSREMLTYDVGC